MAQKTVTQLTVAVPNSLETPTRHRRYKALYAVEFFERKRMDSYALWAVKLREGHTYQKIPAGYGKTETLEQAHIALTHYCQERGLCFDDIRQDIIPWRLVKDLLEGKHGAEYFARQVERRGGTAISQYPDAPNSLVIVVNDKPMTTSFIVAERFGKSHKYVLRAIDRLPKDDFNRLNFEPVDYTDQKGERRPMYRMTWKGFSMLGMGFTGSKAYVWKQTFLDAFEAMGSEIERRKAHYADPPRTALLSLKREAHHPMMDALIEMREDLGKATDERHYMCENKLCNGIVTGEFKAVDEKDLSLELRHD